MEGEEMGGIERWFECEDWVEFYSGRDIASCGRGIYRTLVNFGGPGARTAYYFYARVAEGSEECIQDITLEGETFISERKRVDVPGTPRGFSWVYLGYVESRRDYRMLTINAPNGMEGFDRLCVLQIPRRLESGEVERRIEAEKTGGEPLSGVPLGGVGAGKIELCRDGLFRNITINGNIDTPVWRSDSSFFVLRAETGQGALGRIVSSKPLYGLVPMEKTEFDGAYPQASINLSDRYFPLRVEIKATGPVIPGNMKDSSLPIALFRVRLISESKENMKASVAIFMENFLGCGGAIVEKDKVRNVWDEGYYQVWSERAGNTEREWKSGEGRGVIYEGGEKEEVRSNGSYVLATNLPVTSIEGGIRQNDMERALRAFIDKGKLRGISGGRSEGEITTAGVSAEIEMKPGEVRDINFVFSWYVPCFRQSGETDYGHYYMNHFSSASDVAEYGLKNFDLLEAASGEVPELLFQSTLPEWFARTLCNDAYAFSTASWLTKDGRFSINEGPTHMFGCMGTLDQKLYANHYYSLFFPSLDRTELLAFVRSQSEDGGVQHDLGYGHIDQKGQKVGWPDLTSSLAILSLKHYQLTGDEEYIKEAYPHIIKGLFGYQLGMDSDGDGIANISGVGNTFDSEKYEGTSSYIATLWLAALKALENLAGRFGDQDTAEECRKLFNKAKKSAIAQLWNGSYFANYYDASKGKGSPNSHISQVAGEFFARLCGLGPLYGDHYVKEAVDSMLALNYHDRFILPTNEATPEGEMPVRTMWGWLPHARIFLGGLPLYFGREEAAMQALQRMDGAICEYNNDNRWDLRLFYEPDTGKEHWGRFYMTSPVTWYVYQALLGYRLDKPDGLLEIIPNLPESMLPFSGPLFLPGFWAWLEVDKSSGYIGIQVLKRFNTGVSVKKLQLPAWHGTLTLFVNGSLAGVESMGSCLMGEAYRCSIDFQEADEILLKWER